MGGGCPCHFPLTRLPLWHWAVHSRADRLSRAKSRKNQPGNPVEETRVYLFSWSGDWVLPTLFSSYSAGWCPSRDSGCKHLWSRKTRVFIQISRPGNTSKTVLTCNDPLSINFYLPLHPKDTEMKNREINGDQSTLLVFNDINNKNNTQMTKMNFKLIQIKTEVLMRDWYSLPLINILWKYKRVENKFTLANILL